MANDSAGRSFPLDLGIDVPVEAVTVSPHATERVGDIHAAGIFDMATQYALAQAILCFGLSPLMQDFQRDGVVRVPRAVEEHRLHHRYTLGLMRFLVTQDLMKEGKDETFMATPKGRAAFSKAAVGWLELVVGGYGRLMYESLPIMRGDLKYGQDLRRDPLHVSVGSSAVSSSIGDDVPYWILEREGVTRVADLGCGSGTFLIELAKRDPKWRCVGIDLAPEAIKAANEAAKAAKVDDRVKFVVGDLFDLGAVGDVLEDVDLFHSFGVEHETLRDGEQAVLSHIDGLATLFPGKKFLLGEPMLHMQQGDGVFYWLHILSDQGLPRNIPGWHKLLARLKKCKLTNVYVPDHQKIGAYFMIQLDAK